MNITRVECDGVEFFTINATGESGMSESGLARLCGVTHQAISKLLQNSVATKSPSECLESLFGNDFRLQPSSDSVTTKSPSESLEPLFSNDFRLQPSGDIAAQLRGLDNATVIRSEFCSKVIEYYAFESKYKTKEALFAFRKFAEMGIQTWIQGITGWQTEQELPSRRVVRTQLSASRKHQAQSQLAPQLPPPDAIEIDLATIDLLTSETTQGSTYRLYLQLLKLEALEQRPDHMAIADASNIKHSTFYTSIKHLQNLGLCPDWLEPKPRIGLEKAIRGGTHPARNRLHQDLGGQVEAPTKFGPVDLLTATELIEVKEFPDWKTGLGQILAKSSCYPSHTKRLHLFGRAVNHQNIQACCAEFDISVTVESEFLSQN